MRRKVLSVFHHKTIDYALHPDQNQSLWRLLPIPVNWKLTMPMKDLFPQVSLPREETCSARDYRGVQTAGVNPADLQDVLHELRQPLGVIESLAYYLELTSTDERTSTHLQRIQAMVVQANGILERACGKRDLLALGAAR
ncbi:MAG: hypothetical protein JO033_27725 [Acidobacteriaceae bacterium]|nr:hypothetical protein [Acidobacteriaceae bacterium]